MQEKITLQLLNLLGFIIMVTVNYAANAMPINNMTTGELSDQFPNLFTPAGITFSIWGVIYLLLLFLVIFQARDILRSHKKENPFLHSTGYLFFLSCLLNAGWIFAWHYMWTTLSLVIMVLLLLVLLKIYLNLGIGIRKTSLTEKILVHLPFQIYLGWIVVATLANTNALLVDLGYHQLGTSPLWTIFLIAVASFITMIFMKYRGDLAINLVALWAFSGIIIKRIEVEPVEILVVVGAGAAMVLIAVFSVTVKLQKRRQYA